MITPEWITPELFTPELIFPELITPEIVTLKLITPKLITPEFITPELIIPELITPELHKYLQTEGRGIFSKNNYLLLLLWCLGLDKKQNKSIFIFPDLPFQASNMSCMKKS